MKVVPFNIEIGNHALGILDMLESHGMNELLIHDLPEHGLIAFEGNQIVAAGFIRRIEGYDAFLDSFITSPNAPGELRNRALDTITRKLIEWAKSNNVRNIYAFSADRNTQLRANKHGLVDFKSHLFQAVKLN